MDHAAHQGHHGHHAHHAHHGHAAPTAAAPSLDRIAFLATLHCLSGCAVGEVAGMVIGTALGFSNGETIALAVALDSFLFWGSLAAALAIAGVAAFPLNRWLIARGQGHAVVHAHH